MTLCLVTSIIFPPNTPLSYINTRSVFTPQERFEQTLQTIKSVRMKLPDSQIMIVECMDPVHDYEIKTLQSQTDIFINLYTNTNDRTIIYGKSKSHAEGTMTIRSIEYIVENNINFDYMWKISGRYYLNDSFVDDNSLPPIIIVKPINNDKNNMFTALYKLDRQTAIQWMNVLNTHKTEKPINNDKNSMLTALYKLDRQTAIQWMNFLNTHKTDMHNCIGFEILFGMFLKGIDNDKIKYVNNIGIEGLVSVCGTFYTG